MSVLKSCRVQRYGHFEDLNVEFGAGCTVVYGENEAGKSTLLDALGDFLWGFPARHHPREFVYRRNQMLIEGTVALDGEHTYTRQPSRLTRDSIEIEAAPWEVGLTRQHWDHAYGLNLPRLEEGGRRIVSGRDDPGGISFLADTGLPIDEVMGRISERQKDLFGTHANNKNSAIRKLLVRLGEIDERIEDAGASAQDIDNLQARLEELTTSSSTKTGLLDGLDEQITVLKELLHALENVAQLEQVEEEIARLGKTGRVLSETETAALGTALRDLADTEADVSDLTAALAGAQEKLESLEPRADVLERAGEIRAAVRELEARRDDTRTLLNTSAAASHRQEVVNLLDDLGQAFDDLEVARRKVMISSDRHEQLDRLADTCEAASTALGKQRQKVREAQARLQEESTPAAGSETLVAQLLRRDEAWQAIRMPWIEGDFPDDAVRVELATRLDTAIEAADAEAERAAQALEALGVSRGKRQEAQAALIREQELLAVAEADEEANRTAWVALTKDCGLPKGLDPQAWRTRADILRRLNQAWQKWQEAESRHQAALERVTEYQSRIEQIAPLLAAPTGDALTDIEALDQLRDDAEVTATEVRGIQKAIDDATAELGAAVAAKEAGAANVTALAGDDDPAELLERSTTHLQLQERRANIEKLIAAATPSFASLAEVRTVLGDRDRASLKAEEAQLASQRLALATAIAEDERAVGATQTELSTLQHKEGTAALLAERQEVCAQIAELAEQYRNLHVQELILQQYAKLNAEHSDTPILDRAGVYLNTLTSGRHQGFSIITIGAIKHLRIQSLVGDTIQDTEPANLSDGTEHQVYFALRLAGIAARQEERRRKGQPTIPVVLDDVFQAFDDDRSATALQLLAELGKEFQIIVMTHERAVYNIAEEMPDVQTVRLSAPRAPATV